MKYRIRNTDTGYGVRAMAIAIAAAFAAPYGMAQEATLNTTVVTASRQSTPVNELLSDVTVLDREEIEAAGPSASLADLLARQPGLEINRKGGMGADSSVFIRGTNAGHTVLLIDGVRAGSATLGQPNLAYLPLQEIERIEILRGPASSLYGSDAIGGVIQVFTRKGEGPPSVNAEAGYGTHRTRAASAGVSGGAGGWSYSLQAGDQRTNGFSNTNPQSPYSYNPDRDGYRNTNASGRLAYTFAREQEAGISFLYADGWNDFDNGQPYRRDYTEQKLSSFSLYSLNRLSSFWKSTVRLGQSVDDEVNYSSSYSPDGGKFKTKQTQYQWQNDIRLPVGTALLAVERLEEKVSGDTAYDIDKRHIDSVVAGWGGNFDAHRLQLDLRRDKNSQYGGKTTGFASYGYQFSSAWRANASYGTAFRAPTFNDLYYPPDSYGMHGNPNLKPEDSKNKEVAVHYQTRAHHASVTAYQNDIKNLIDWVPDSSWIYSPSNVDKSRLRGITLAYGGTLGGFDIKASADFQDPRNRETDKILRYRSRRHGSLSVGRHHERLDWNLEWQANSKRYREDNAGNVLALGGYTLLNLQAGYSFARDWTAFVRANNILDKHYTLNYGNNTDGANFFAGVRYAMGK